MSHRSSYDDNPYKTPARATSLKDVCRNRQILQARLAWSTTATTITLKLQKGPYSRQLFPWTAIESKMLELVLHSFVGCFQLNLRK
jgi:hypothetical protein